MQPWEHTTSTQSTAPCTTTCCVRYHDAPQTHGKWTTMKTKMIKKALKWTTHVLQRNCRCNIVSPHQMSDGHWITKPWAWPPTATASDEKSNVRVTLVRAFPVREHCMLSVIFTNSDPLNLLLKYFTIHPSGYLAQPFLWTSDKLVIGWAIDLDKHQQRCFLSRPFI